MTFGIMGIGDAIVKITPNIDNIIQSQPSAFNVFDTAATVMDWFMIICWALVGVGLLISLGVFGVKKMWAGENEDINESNKMTRQLKKNILITIAIFGISWIIPIVGAIVSAAGGIG